MQAQKGYPDWMVKRVKVIPKGKGFTWKAISSGKFIYVKDAENNTVIGQAGKVLGTKSYISLPLKLKGRVVGVVNINSLRKSAFSRDDVLILKQVAKQLEIAINNAKKAGELEISQRQLTDNVSLLERKK